MAFNCGKVACDVIVLSLDLSFTSSNHVSLSNTFSGKMVNKVLVLCNSVVEFCNSCITFSNYSV